MAITDYDDLFNRLGHRRHVAAGADLLREGDRSTQLFFVAQGGVRLWHNDDGRDITVQFFFENQIVASFESFYLEKPSLFSITALEPTTVIAIDSAVLQRSLQQEPALLAAFTNHICQRFIDYTRYFLNRIEQSPESRYRSLVAADPALVARVPQHELASYLGITPVSLSRIRNRVKNTPSA
ncbi:MAG: Crp/Fnr family transcriptional regulator [Lactobacillus sp.]|jgi:CRP-like cAMP-binding protein|nr:Crp/Fnr family transcriptional regulator [Lactobacillus sp.]MCI2031942.1 Crp/Fnr family transcriptional regulator [Lactobacillus sp.]